MVIYLGPTLPPASSGALMRNVADGQPLFLGLAPSRGLPSQHLSMLLVRSYRTFAPLPVPGEVPTGHRRCVSVALSSRSPALGVTQQAWPSGSPDFPQQMVEDNLLQPPRLLSAFIMPCGHTLENRSSHAIGAVAQPDRATVS